MSVVTSSTQPTTIEAVVFDWGGTLTPFATIDLREQWLRYAEVADPNHADELSARLFAAEDDAWRAGREHRRSATLDQIFRGVGIEPVGETHDRALATYHAFWEPYTFTDPDAAPLFTALRERGIKVGILSNTLWSRGYHERVFRRDGVLDLIDGAAYSSELAWTKPHPEAFRTAMSAVGVTDPAQVVFVGDRPYEDIHGAKAVGMRAVLVPHSVIPGEQRGHVEGDPDAVIDRLADLLPVVDGWRSGRPGRKRPAPQPVD